MNIDDRRRVLPLVDMNKGGEQYEVPSYTNTGGSGNRTSIITVDVDEHAATFWRGMGTDPATRQRLVNGDLVSAGFINNDLAVAGRWLEFDFLGDKELITEAKFYVTNAFANCGVWKWQGFDGASWNDIGGSFTLGVTGVVDLIQTITTLSSNIQGYFKYRMIGVSGNSNFNLFNFAEMEFKIGGLL